MRKSRRTRQGGLVLLAVLLFVLVTTLAASTMVVMYDTVRKREKEEELLFAGGQIRKAIVSYYNTIPPAGARSLPPSLDALLNDTRFPMPVQHLRRLYADPMTGRADWTPILGVGGIAGVRSRSTAAPIKRSGFPKPFEEFEKKELYSEWAFMLR